MPTTTTRGLITVETPDEYSPEDSTRFEYRYRDSDNFTDQDFITVAGAATAEQIDTILASLTGPDSRDFLASVIGFDHLREGKGGVRRYDPKHHEVVGIEVGWFTPDTDLTIAQVVAGFERSGKKMRKAADRGANKGGSDA